MANKDIFANRERVKVSVGADSGVVAYTQLNTSMHLGQGDPRKWILIGATVGPYSNGDIGEIDATSARATFQICQGKKTALENNDSSQCLTHLEYASLLNTNGLQSETWPKPFPILSPLPVLSNHMTFLIQTVADAPSFDSQSFLFEIWYFVAGAAPSDISELVASQGALT